METFQIFIKLLDGRTQCLKVNSPTISGEFLNKKIYEITRIPVHYQRLLSGSREIQTETQLSACDDKFFPSCNLVLRLPGGKGGFGSLLRGAATKAGQKKTNNFDACRDMSGRRLRHVNAEKKLEEWRAEAAERKLEKLAEDFLKKKAKDMKKNESSSSDKYVEKYREESSKCMEEVEESVRKSFGIYKETKRKILPGSDLKSKRLKIWLGKEKELSDSDDDQDDDSDDESDEKSVLDEGLPSISRKDDEGSLCSISAQSSDSGSLGGSSSGLDEENGINVHKDSLSGGDSDSRPVDFEVGSIPTKQDNGLQRDDTFRHGENGSFEKKDIDAGQNFYVEAIGIAANGFEEQVKKAEEGGIDMAIVSNLERLLDFSDYNSAKDMEVLGMERLKSELQTRGLKCGGTLQERAARLFLLKTTPIEMIPKKLLAKPSK